ncbi:hypothetical protein BDZ91DRAFT_834558 [Kalaharituber pfeilii]|nr:hypothetical protein BDZ91DRAFT_834558 [Kalaharituber pfeilii]
MNPKRSLPPPQALRNFCSLSSVFLAKRNGSYCRQSYTIYTVEMSRADSSGVIALAGGPSRRPVISSSSRNNADFPLIRSDVLRAVPQDRLHAFASFLRDHTEVLGDPRFIAIQDGVQPLTIDAGLVLGGEADVRLAAYHSIVLPVWGLVGSLRWPSVNGEKWKLCWVNEQGQNVLRQQEPERQSIYRRRSSVPDTTLCVLYIRDDGKQGDNEGSTKKGKQRALLPRICGSICAIIEYKGPGCLDTVIVRGSTSNELQLVTDSSNWANLACQLRKYAVEYGVHHQLVMDNAYALYLEFPDHASASDNYDDEEDIPVWYLIVSFAEQGTGIWGVRYNEGHEADIVLNAREVVAFLLWAATSSLEPQGPAPDPAELEAIKRQGARQCGSANGGDEGHGKRRTRSQATSGASGDSGDPRSTKYMRTEGGSETSKDETHGDEPTNSAGGYAENRSTDPEWDHVFGYLPPVGTVFELIPAPLGCQSRGFREDANGKGNGTAMPVQRDPIRSIPLRQSRAKAIHTITKAFSTGPCESGPRLVARICKLCTPSVAVINILSPMVPNIAAGNLTLIMKSYPDHLSSNCSPRPLPSQPPFSAELSAYKAFLNAASSISITLPTVSSVHSCAARRPYRPGIDGVTLYDYFFPPAHKSSATPTAHTSRSIADIPHRNNILHKLYLSAQKTLRWMHKEADVCHRDWSASNMIVLPAEQEVVIIDFGRAAVGNRVPEGWGGAERGTKRRTVDAVKGWGEADCIYIRAVFEGLGMQEEDVAHEAEDHEEEGNKVETEQEEEEENEE